jgi:hypothetical protein
LIFYTLQGPSSEMEIYEDKIRLVKKSWRKIFSRKQERDTFYISELSQFEIIVPKFMFFSGKIQWTTFKGDTASFRFSTNPVMVKKIEVYLKKRVIKNHLLIQQKAEEEFIKPLRKKSRSRDNAA